MKVRARNSARAREAKTKGINIIIMNLDYEIIRVTEMLDDLSDMASRFVSEDSFTKATVYKGISGNYYLLPAVGPYAYVRNPMYIGGFILLVGFGLFHSSVSILLLSIILLLLFHLFVILVEEPTLERTFGESYMEYKKRINRWIPTFMQ